MEGNENRDLRENVIKLSKEIAALSKERSVLMQVVQRGAVPEHLCLQSGMPPIVEVKGPGAEHSHSHTSEYVNAMCHLVLITSMG